MGSISHGLRSVDRVALSMDRAALSMDPKCRDTSIAQGSIDCAGIHRCRDPSVAQGSIDRTAIVIKLK